MHAKVKGMSSKSRVTDDGLEKEGGVDSQAYPTDKLEKRMLELEGMASLGRHLVSVAHELKNPLNFVANSFVGVERQVASIKESLWELLPDGDEGDVIRDLFEDKFASIGTLAKHHCRGTERLSALVTSLSHIARAGLDDRSRINVNRAVEDALLILGSRLKIIQLEKDLADLPEADASLGGLGQIVMNLITNALDACAEIHVPQETRIKIRSWGDEAHIFVSVRDNGPGVLADNASELFKPFFTTKVLDAGTGMGLAVSRKIARAHGGDIQFENTEDGAEFTLKISRAVVRDEEVTAK
jgi:two-component system, NtrC family, sensor kinase